MGGEEGYEAGEYYSDSMFYLCVKFTSCSIWWVQSR